MKRRAVLLLMLLMATSVVAGEVRVAVASNFVTTLRALADEFSTQQSHRVVIIFGSTGKLYAQIANGAPFHLFLSADAQRPKLLEERGMAVDGSRFTYAKGRLVLWGGERRLQDKNCQTLLKSAALNRLAIANPATAPYGLAAQQVLQKMGLWARLKPRLVRGENIAQTFLYVASGNVPLGFVALSQIRRADHGGCRWDVPQEYYTPIEQQAVLLNRGVGSEAAQAFMVFLQSEVALKIINNAGYAI